MDESLAALAVIELPGRSVAADAGQRGHVKHAPQPAVVAFRPVQIATDAAGISWYRDQSGVGRQPPRGGEGGQVAAGNDHEFRAEAGSEAGQRLDDVRVGVITEAFGDGFVDVFDLVVEVEQLAGQPFNQGGGARLPRQSQRLLLGRRHRAVAMPDELVLERENATLKRLLANAELEKDALREIAKGNF